MSTNNTSEALKGWTPSPNGRGSLDILWACVPTIFLSTWSAICLNVPEPSDTTRDQLRRKAWLTFIAIMGPEYLLGFTLGEWQSARASVTHFKQLRQDNKWTLKHAFFADMGGFVLQTSDGFRFFLDTKHIHWLLEHQAISMTQFEKDFLLDSKTIDDRNKSDVFVRIIAVGQALWFCINIIARGIRHLPVTTLEITTIGIIIDSILVYYFWKDKPADVKSMEIVGINRTISEMILLEENEAARTEPYFRTPLDFTSRKAWALNLIYSYLMNILRGMVPQFSQRKTEKPLGRRSENDVLPVTGIAWFITLISAYAFLGTNFIAWNFHFPTLTERLLWRLSSCALVALFTLGLLVIGSLYGDRGIRKMQEGVRKRRGLLADSSLPLERAHWKDRLVYRFWTLAMKLMNNSPENDPNLDVSLVFLLGLPCFAVYTIIRAYILVEDVVAFRALPADAYKTVDWWGLIPHIT